MVRGVVCVCASFVVSYVRDWRARSNMCAMFYIFFTRGMSQLKLMRFYVPMITRYTNDRIQGNAIDTIAIVASNCSTINWRS